MSKERELEIIKEIEARMARLEAADQALFQRKLEQAKQIEDQNRRYEKQEKILKQINIELDEISKESELNAGITSDILTSLSKQNLALKQQKNIASQINKISYQALATRQGEMDINRKALENFNQQTFARKEMLVKRRTELNLGGALNKQQQAELNNINDLLTSIESQRKANQQILDTDKRIESSIGNTAGILKGLDKSLQKAGFSSLGISDAFNKTKREAQELEFSTGEIQKGTKLLGMFAKNVFDNFAEGLSTTKLLELAVLAVGKAMMFIDKNSGALAKQLGISNVQARGLISSFNEISINSDNTFVNTKNLTEAFGQLTQSLGVAKLASDAILESQVKLTKQAGYTNEAAVELAKLGAIQNTDAEGLLSNFLGQSEALNIQNGLQINSKQLAESALKTSKATLLSLRGQGNALGEAAFEAKKLGLELSQIEGIADSLLNIESSIAAEFEAEVILGRQLNLERARFYALTNDIAGLAREINAQGITANSFAKMTRIEQEATAKALGLSREAMGEMLFEQEALSKLSGKADENAQTRFNNLVKEVGLERAKKQLGNETLANQLASANVQERFTAAIEKIQTLFLSLAEPLMPVVDAFVSILGTVGGLVARFTPLLGFLAKAYALIKGIGLSFKGIQMIRAAIFSLSKKQLATDAASNNLSKLQNFYLKQKAFFSGAFLNTTKSALIANKLGLINAKQLAYWKGRETFLGKKKNLQLATAQMYEKASLLSSIRKNVVEKAGNAIRKVKLTLEEGTLGKLIAQNFQRAIANTREKALNVLKGIQLMYQKLEIVNLIRSNALRARAFFRTVGTMFADVVKSLSKVPVVGPIIGAALAAGLVAGAIALFNKKGDDVFSKPSGGSGYGDRMLLGPEGAISLNNKDTVIAGTNLFPSKKGDDVVSSPAGAVQMAPELDYNKLAAAIGGAVNNKQVTLSYTDFAQKTRPVFG